MAPFVRLYKFDNTTPIEAMINAHYHYIKISLCVHVCVSDRIGMFKGRGTRPVVHDLCTCYTLFCVWSSLGVGTEADTIWEQELKWTQSGSSS